MHFGLWTLSYMGREVKALESSELVRSASSRICVVNVHIPGLYKAIILCALTE